MSYDLSLPTNVVFPATCGICLMYIEVIVIES